MTTDPTHIIQVHQLTVKRDSRTILKAVDFTLRKKERVLLHSPIGTGKTTFLHTLMGFIPFSGTITLFGQTCHKEDDFAHFRGDYIGLLFQQCRDQLFGPTVEEDVAFGLLNLGYSKKEALYNAHQQLESLKISHLAKRAIYQLSGGEMTLTALAGILIMNPQILLLDEPTNNLDPHHRQRVIKILQETDSAIVIASHDETLSDTLSATTFKLNPLAL